MCRPAAGSFPRAAERAARELRAVFGLGPAGDSVAFGALGVIFLASFLVLVAFTCVAALLLAKGVAWLGRPVARALAEAYARWRGPRLPVLARPELEGAGPELALACSAFEHGDVKTGNAALNRARATIMRTLGRLPRADARRAKEALRRAFAWRALVLDAAK